MYLQLHLYCDIEDCYVIGRNFLLHKKDMGNLNETIFSIC